MDYTTWIDLTEAQKAKIEILRDRFHAYKTEVSPGGFSLPTGWISLVLTYGKEKVYCFGISPEGDSHS